MPEFVHLHVHSQYSLLDGLSKTEELVDQAKAMGMQALALTDHGTLHGAIKFYSDARRKNILPIVGMEAYLAKRSRFEKVAHVDDEPYHLVLLAKNYRGYQNLIQLTTHAHLEGFYYKPRLDRELLQKHRDGLVCLSACLDGEIPRAINNLQYEEARKTVKDYLDLFGKENFFLELQRHQLEKKGELFKKQERANQGILKLAKDLDLPVVATNDCHYVKKDDALAQDALLAIQTKQLLADPNRKLTMIDSPDFYLRSPSEMDDLFVEHPEALENTLQIADRCFLEIPMGDFIFPKFEVPTGESPEKYLRSLTWQKAAERLTTVTPTIKERLEYELNIVTAKGYSTYFLIFADLAEFCRQHGIITNTRGSAAGSLVLYVLGVTTLNPLDYHLPFERFLYKERVSPPDIDLDIADDRREEVIAYVVKRYGQENVAQIVSFGTMEARAAVRDAGRVMGLAYSFCDGIAKMIPPGMGLTEAEESVYELREICNTNQDAKKLISLAEKLEGVARHSSVHPAGLVIADKPLLNYVPLMKETKGEKIITQFDMYSLDLNVSSDAIGLLKLDLLGIRNLSILSLAVELVRKEQNIDIDLDNLPLNNDEKTFQMLGRGETTGVFQLESAGMRKNIKNLRPTSVTDLMAMVALYRPGPMEKIPAFIARKHNPKLISYPDERLKEILKDSYGVITYQDDVLLTAVHLAGYSWLEVDQFRKAIGKKIKTLLLAQKDKFVHGCVRNGITREKAAEIFKLIEPFARYGFNKAHAASYARVAYQTSYMKANFPVEFMTALLTCESHNTDKVSLVSAECRRIGIEVLPPDINRSKTNFAIEKQNEGRKRTIRFGLSAIKNVGEAAAELVVCERETHGEFTSLAEFCRRVDLKSVNKKVLESLIRVGAMDVFGPRAAQLKVLAECMKQGISYQKKNASGQRGLFDQHEEAEFQHIRLPKLGEVPKAQLLNWEKELLGFYLTEHPRVAEMKRLPGFVSHRLSEVSLEEVGRKVVLGGMIAKLRIIVTRKSNEEMAFVRLQDEEGSLEAIVFPRVFHESKNLLREDEIVLMHGRVDHNEESDLKVLVDKVVPLERAGELK